MTKFDVLPQQDKDIIKQILTNKLDEDLSGSLKKLSLAGLIVLGSLLAKQSSAQTGTQQYGANAKVNFGTVNKTIDSYTKTIFGNKATEIVNSGIVPTIANDGSVIYFKLENRFKLPEGDFVAFKVNKYNKIDLITIDSNAKILRNLDYTNLSGEQALDMVERLTMGRINQTLRDPSTVVAQANIQKENKVNKLRETIRAVIKRELTENQPKPQERPQEKPGPVVAPGKPSTDKPKPRRPLGNPDVKPKPKASLKEEEEMLARIVDRFKSKKAVNEGDESSWQKGYQQGYNEGFKDAKANKSNKFSK